ncbi:MAG: nucleoid-associated protein [Candidatus Obscuribacterales bacterium]|nr:nucleoid-associated protein [Candidatus Obscuribacterales bacterium]
MVDISSAKINKVIIHRVGNKLREEGVLFSPKESPRSKTLDELLLKGFLAPVIRQGQQYDLFHESNLSLNAINHYSSIIFSDPKSFRSSSEAIAKHLYSSSTHPNIGGGEFLVILFDDIRLDETSLQALGFFKVEGKDDYLDVGEEDGTIQVLERTGISLEKVQKGAIVLSNSTKVFAVDALGQKTKYWLESFLKATPSQTPKACAKVAGALIKAISSKVELPSNALEFGRLINEKLSESDVLTIEGLKEISAPFISEEEVNSLIDGARLKSGFTLENKLEVESKQLSRYAKDVVTKARITEGVSLLISNADARINSIDVKQTKSGVRAIVDIQLKGD